MKGYFEVHELVENYLKFNTILNKHTKKSPNEPINRKNKNQGLASNSQLC